MTQQTTDWMADLMLDRVKIVPGVSAAVIVVVVAPEAVGRISRLGFCSPRMTERVVHSRYKIHDVADAIKTQLKTPKAQCLLGSFLAFRCVFMA